VVHQQVGEQLDRTITRTGLLEGAFTFAALVPLVCIVGVWQRAQPTLSNTCRPACALALRVGIGLGRIREPHGDHEHLPVWQLVERVVKGMVFGVRRINTVMSLGAGLPFAQL